MGCSSEKKASAYLLNFVSWGITMPLNGQYNMEEGPALKRNSCNLRQLRLLDLSLSLSLYIYIYIRVTYMCVCVCVCVYGERTCSEN